MAAQLEMSWFSVYVVFGCKFVRWYAMGRVFLSWVFSGKKSDKYKIRYEPSESHELSRILVRSLLPDKFITDSSQHMKEFHAKLGGGGNGPKITERLCLRPQMAEN